MSLYIFFLKKPTYLKILAKTRQLGNDNLLSTVNQ